MSAPLACRCKKVKGQLSARGQAGGRRVICYCDDCQAFAHKLNASVLDPCGGTDLFQVYPADIRLDEGRDYVTHLTLTPGGLHRWYASCCNTPIANTVSASLPFVGVLHSFIVDFDTWAPDVSCKVHGRFASGEVAPPGAHAGIPLRLIPQYLSMFVWGWITGKHKPHPFYSHKASQ